jgi:hypothetical protein
MKFWHWIQLTMSMFKKNYNIIESKTLCDSCLGIFFFTGLVVDVATVMRSWKTHVMVCKQTWCFVQHMYLHIHFLLLIIHLLIEGFLLLVFEYLLYFLHGMIEVRVFVSLTFFFLKKLENLCMKIMLRWFKTFWTYCATNANVPSLPSDQLIHSLHWLTHVFYF